MGKEKFIAINSSVSIPLHEIQVLRVKSSGAGGQNVNKRNTQIQLIWSVAETSCLSQAQKDHLAKKIRLNQAGELVVRCGRHRSQSQNQEEALERLVQRIAAGLRTPRVRKATKIPKQSKTKRLNDKRHRSEIKKGRGTKY